MDYGKMEEKVEMEYENKPSDKAIKDFRERIKEFLTKENIFISVDIDFYKDTDKPREVYVSVGGHGERYKKWIKEVKIKDLRGNDLKIKGLEEYIKGIDEKMSDAKIQDICFEIKQQLHKLSAESKDGNI